jgi:hypothetical protein
MNIVSAKWGHLMAYYITILSAGVIIEFTMAKKTS